MLLAIDAGNTNIVFAVQDGETLRDQWRTATDETRTADEYFVWLNELMKPADLDPEDIDGAIIACVVPRALYSLRDLCQRHFATQPLIIGEPGVDPGLEVRVDHPADVGADRLVNAVAAHMAHEGALIILDFGTATTFDVVDANGDYRGGIIAPGVNLSLDALERAAAKLPLIAIRKPDRVIGGGTVAAMESGVFWGYVSLIEGLVARVREEFGGPMKVVATGGLASLFGDSMDVIDHIDKDLTIRGLVELYRRNAVS